MISIKICKREDGSFSSVLIQGHTGGEVCAAIDALTQSCGRQLENMKSAKMSIDEKGICLIEDMRKSKPALAVIDALVNGLESIAKQNKFSVQIMYLWE